MRPAGIYKSHDLMTYISQSTEFGQHEAGASVYFGHISSYHLAVII